MQRKNPGKAMCYLVVICALVSALAMDGCGGGDDDDGGTVTSGQTIPSVNTGAVNVTSSNVQALVGEQLIFPNGSIFDPSLGNNPATLTFTSANPPTFTLTSGGATSSGNATFGSCTLNFTQGPLAGPPPKSITFNPCTFQITASNVTVGGGAVPGTLTLTLGTTVVTFNVQVSILSNGTLLVNGKSTGIIISSNGTPVTTGSTGSSGQ
jgi:hypothetical protein